MLEELMWNRQKPLDRLELVCLLLNKNFHDPIHRCSCRSCDGKTCRYRVPAIPQLLKSHMVYVEELEKFLTVQERGFLDLYMAQTSRDLANAAGANTYVAYVYSGNLGYYFTKYFTKHSSKDAANFAQASHNFRRHVERNVDSERTAKSLGLGRLMSATNGMFISYLLFVSLYSHIVVIILIMDIAVVVVCIVNTVGVAVFRVVHIVSY
jgi:hypothetical protein